MAQLTINIGSAPNDGTGDSARQGGSKINANFSELYGLVQSLQTSVGFSGNYNDLSNLPTLGTAAALDVGTGALDVVQLDGDGKLPAVDGSNLTNLPGGGGDVSISGTPSATQLARWTSATAIEGVSTISKTYITGLGTAADFNVGTGANQIVQLNGSAQLPAVDGSLLTNLPADVSVSGTPIDDQFARWTDANTVEGVDLSVLHLTDMDSIASGDLTRQAFDAIVTDDDTELVALIATFIAILNEGGASFDLAAKEDLWEATPGLLLITAQVQNEAEEEQPLTPDVSENIEIDGELGWNFFTTVDANCDINSIVNLIPGKAYKLRILADGGNFDVLASGADRTFNFDAGVTIPDGDYANFIILLDDALLLEVSFGGLSD